MNLQKGLEGEISRRRFLGGTGRVLLGGGIIYLINYLKGCLTGNGGGNGDGGNGGGDDNGVSYDDYIPDVDAQPPSEPAFENVEETTESLASYLSGNSQLYVAVFHSGDRRQISGLDAVLHSNPNGAYAEVSDPTETYLPAVASLTSAGYIDVNGRHRNGVPRRSDVIDLINYIEMFLSADFQVGDFVSVRQIEEALPNWNPEHVSDFPGIIYRGDWSLNQMRNLDILVNRGSAVLTFFPPTAAGASYTYAVTSTILNVFNFLEDIIDFVDPFVPWDLSQIMNFEIPMYSVGIDTTQIMLDLMRRDT
ncbi:MAG: hypothetical protein ABIH49_02720 [archaeon]